MQKLALQLSNKKIAVIPKNHEQYTHARCELLCKKGSLVNPNGRLKNHRVCNPSKIFQTRKNLVLDIEWELMGNNMQEKAQQIIIQGKASIQSQ